MRIPCERKAGKRVIRVIAERPDRMLLQKSRNACYCRKAGMQIIAGMAKPFAFRMRRFFDCGDPSGPGMHLFFWHMNVLYERWRVGPFAIKPDRP